MDKLTEKELINLKEFLSYLRNPDYSPNYLTEENEIFKISTASFVDYEDEDGNLLSTGTSTRQPRAYGGQCHCLSGRAKSGSTGGNQPAFLFLRY